MSDKPDNQNPKPAFSLMDLAPDLFSEEPPELTNSIPNQPVHNNSTNSIPTPSTPPATPKMPLTNVGNLDDFKSKLASSVTRLPDPKKTEKLSDEGKKPRLSLPVIIGIVLVPILALLVVFVIPLLQSPPTSAEIERGALTPLVRVVGITPTVAKIKTDCPKITPLNPIDAFPCSKTLQYNDDLKSFLNPAEDQLNKDGHGLVGKTQLYAVVTTVQSDQIIEFYDNSFSSKGFVLSKKNQPNMHTDLGDTPIGLYRVAYYFSGKTNVQIALFILKKDGPQDLKAKQILMRQDVYN